MASGYASALVEACSDKKALESVHGDMETIAAYMAANPSVGTFLSNPTMDEKAKKDVLSKIHAGDYSRKAKKLGEQKRGQKDRAQRMVGQFSLDSETLSTVMGATKL